MNAKKVYAAPTVEIVPVAVNSMLMVSVYAPAADGAHYGIFFWDPSNVDAEGFNIWSE